jgi:hypothetical protein
LVQTTNFFEPTTEYIPVGQQVLYDEAGVAVGVKSDGQVAKSRMVVGDPSYFPGKARLAAKVVRAIAFMVRPRRGKA